jgi:hypothetical protein
MGAFGGQEIPTEVGDDDIIIPSHFSLMQNYPNPFNATTAMRFILPETGEVVLSIYNILGQRVETLLENTLQAGEHTVTWDASGLPSGVYFARLEIKEHAKSIKMVLLK